MNDGELAEPAVILEVLDGVRGAERDRSGDAGADGHAPGGRDAGVSHGRARFARGSVMDLRADAPLAGSPEAEIGDEVDGDTLEADPSAPPSSRKVRKRTKRDRPRSKTIAMKRVTRAELQLGAMMYPPVEGIERPRTRAECTQEARPCPWVSCKHHLYLDINPETGSIKINFPDLEPWEMKHTCSLDVADAGALTLEEIGFITNLTRERIRQVEVRGLLKLKARRELR